MSDTINKYPVFYNGEEYEIIIEKYIGTHITIYKVKKYSIFHITMKRYQEVHNILLSDYIISKAHTNESEEDYYIKLFKYAFEEYLKKVKKEEFKNKQLTALKEWDGIIE